VLRLPLLHGFDVRGLTSGALLGGVAHRGFYSFLTNPGERATPSSRCSSRKTNDNRRSRLEGRLFRRHEARASRRAVENDSSVRRAETLFGV
jgi:hypothetical protein